MKIPFTAEARQKIQAELELLLVQEKEVIVRLQQAREMGDLSENGAYIYAKMELGRVRRRLRELNHLLENSVVMEKSSGNIIQFGSQVTIVDTETKEELQFMIVSKHESNPSEKKLSYESPIGKELWKKSINEEIKVVLPKKTRTFRITKIA
jgi:transcription elongation factor GreA